MASAAGIAAAFAILLGEDLPALSWGVAILVSPIVLRVGVWGPGLEVRLRQPFRLLVCIVSTIMGWGMAGFTLLVLCAASVAIVHSCLPRSTRLDWAIRLLRVEQGWRRWDVDWDGEFQTRLSLVKPMRAWGLDTATRRGLMAP